MGWDKGLDYRYMYNKLLRSIHTKTNKNIKSLCYDMILLTQLRNGSRISEAIRAIKEWARTGKTELMIRVSKKKKSEERLMIIPAEIINLHDKCLWITDVDDLTLNKRLRVYAIKEHKFNTHSLRYAFITYLLKNGVSPSIIAKITKHSKLDFILTYTQEKAASEILKSID